MQFKQEKTVLVTGGAGYVGSQTCKHLARSGYLPVTLDDLSTGHKRMVRWGPLEVGAVGDRALLSSLCKKFQPIAVNFQHIVQHHHQLPLATLIILC